MRDRGKTLQKTRASYEIFRSPGNRNRSGAHFFLRRKPLALPKHAQIVDRPLFPAYGWISNLDAIGSGPTVIDNGVAQPGRPTPLLLVARIDIRPQLQFDEEDNRPPVGLKERFNVDTKYDDIVGEFRRF